MTEDAKIQEEQAEQTRDTEALTDTEDAAQSVVRSVRTSGDIDEQAEPPTPVERPTADREDAGATAEVDPGQARSLLLDRAVERHGGLTKEMLEGASDALLWWLYDSMEEGAPASVPPPAKGAAIKDHRPKPGTVKFKRYSERK